MQIIAECGVNWDDLKQAKRMINKSRWALCNYAKFQLYNNNVIRDSPLRAELKERMLTKKDAQELFDYGKKIGHPVIFTPMFPRAVDWIAEMKVPMIKIRYSDRHNIALISKALDVGVPVTISSDRNYPTTFYREPVKRLYCVQKYPASPDDYAFIPEDFTVGAYPGAPIFSGVSDHTSGFEVMQRAKECGADFCEVHVKLSGTDPIEAAWSKTFEELGEWIANKHAEKKM
jgi:sialic acid synthase SpsE